MNQLTPELIEKLDHYAESPEKVATRVYTILKAHEELTQYDLYCFAIEMLALGAINGELKYAEGSIKLTTRDFYFAHYLRVSECLTSEAAGQQTDDSISAGPLIDSKKHLRLLS